MNHSARVWLLCCCLLGAAPPAPADDQVQAVLDKAITAHGGAERLGKFNTEATKSKGVLYLGGGLPFTLEVQLQLPDQLKESTVLRIGGQDLPITVVFNGGKGWVRANDETKEMDEQRRSETQEGFHLARLTRLLALKEKGVELTALGESKIDRRSAFGIKVRCKDHRDVSLHFDADTGLLLKIQRHVLDFETGKEVAEERVFSDYGEVDGLRVARKFVILRGGKKFMEVEVLEAKRPAKLDAEVFAKP